MTSLTDSVPDAAVPGPARRRPVRRGGLAWLSVPGVLFLLVVYVVPLGLLLVKSFTEPTPGLDNYRTLFENAGYVRTILRTLEISAIATVLSLVLGYPVAYVMATAGRRWRTFLTLCVVTPYVTSVLVRTFAWQVVLGQDGPLNRAASSLGLGPYDMLFTPFAVAVGLTHFTLPLMILPLMSAMSQVPANLVPAARSLGAGPATAWAQVYLPQTRPGIEAGVVLCFVYGVGAFVIPVILGGNAGAMLGVTIQDAVTQQADYGFASAASVLLALCVLVVVLLYRWRFGGSLEALAAPRTAGLRARSRRPAGGRVLRVVTWFARPLDALGLSKAGWVVKAFSLVVALSLLLPQFVAIPVSLSSSRAMVVPPPGWSTQWYANLLSADWLRSFVTSLEIAAAVAILATVLGTLTAIGVSRTRGRLGDAAGTLMIVPLLFPTVVASAAFFLTFLPLYLTDTRIGLILADTTLAMPFVFLIVHASARQLDPRLEQAAASLGARRRQQLWRVVLPMLTSSITVAAFLAFTTSFDETPVAIFLTGVNVTTLPVQMYNSLTVQSDPTIAAAAVAIMVVAALAVGLAPLLSGRIRRSASRPTNRSKT
ncbi:ABC transporter permease subunit [Streptomyces sp. NPDC004629]|uniref:ABC transporter permease subunit n=1 Tax=Streptomyces sp. NPDC004629 TaxID=3364705 RepID=UPI00369AC20C